MLFRRSRPPIESEPPIQIIHNPIILHLSSKTNLKLCIYATWHRPASGFPDCEIGSMYVTMKKQHRQWGIRYMDIKSLNYFIEIANQKSMRKAAEALYITQPNLTRTVHALEEELGVRLFIRNNQGVRLTLEGENLYYYAESIMNQMNAIGKLKLLNREAMQSSITISAGKMIMKDDIIFRLYEKLNAKHTKILIHETTVEEVLNDVQELKSEIGIVTVNDYQMPAFKKVAELKNLKITELDRGPVYIHMGRKNPLHLKEKIFITDLMEYPYLHLPLDFFSNKDLNIRLDGQGLMDFHRSIIMDNYHAIIQMIKRTDAFIFGNKWMVEELSSGGICSRILENDTNKVSLMWVQRKKEILSSEAEEFIHMLTKTYSVIT